PRRAKASAVARPMPLDAPVTTTVKGLEDLVRMGSSLIASCARACLCAVWQPNRRVPFHPWTHTSIWQVLSGPLLFSHRAWRPGQHRLPSVELWIWLAWQILSHRWLDSPSKLQAALGLCWRNGPIFEASSEKRCHETDKAIAKI